MSTPLQPLSELTSQAERILIKELGIVDAMRVLNQFRAGSGDYTSEREQIWQRKSVQSIIQDIKSRRPPESH